MVASPPRSDSIPRRIPPRRPTSARWGRRRGRRPGTRRAARTRRTRGRRRGRGGGLEGEVSREVSRVRARGPAPRLWNPEDWRRRVARAALPGAPPRKLPSRDSSGLVASPGRRSRRERPRRRLLTNSASHAKRVKIWPVYRTSSISRDATAPRSKVTSTSLTCRNPTAPTVMPMPRLPKTRTWETRTRTRRGQTTGEKEVVAKEVVASGDA